MTYRDDMDEGGQDSDDVANEYDAEEFDDEEEEPTVTCPYCREEIHEDAQRCPRCGQYISEEDRPAAPKPWWIILGVLAVLYAVYRWTVG